MKRSAEERKTPASKAAKIPYAEALERAKHKPGSRWTEICRSELLERDEEVNFLLNHGCYEQVIEESLAWLRLQPDNLHAIEALLRAKWRTGEIRDALKWVDRALRLNPHEPGYRFMRGLLKQSVGMLQEAMGDFELALRMGATVDFKEKVSEAMRALEDWQLFLLETLLAEDRSFRLAFANDPHAAVRSKGFALTSGGHQALLMLRELQQEGQTGSAGLS